MLMKTIHTIELFKIGVIWVLPNASLVRVWMFLIPEVLLLISCCGESFSMTENCLKHVIRCCTVHRACNLTQFDLQTTAQENWNGNWCDKKYMCVYEMLFPFGSTVVVSKYWKYFDHLENILIRQEFLWVSICSVLKWRNFQVIMILKIRTSIEHADPVD